MGTNIDPNNFFHEINKIQISSESGKEGIKLPDWASFMIWAGYRMSTTQINDGRVLMTILLPTRVCCSIFCLLGGLIGRASLSLSCVPDLSYEEFKQLPADTEIYLRDNGKRIKGIISGRQNICNLDCQIVTVKSGGKKYSNSSFGIHKNNFKDYGISCEAHLSAIAEKKIDRVSKYYRKFCPKISKNWIGNCSTEIVAWTNKAKLKREAEGLNISIGGLKPISITELLLLNSNRVLLKSPKSPKAEYHHCPLAILDGPQSFSRLEHLQANNIILLIDRSEYTPSEENQLASVVGYRDDTLIDKSKFKIDKVPTGTELMTFAIRS